MYNRHLFWSYKLGLYIRLANNEVKKIGRRIAAAGNISYSSTKVQNRQGMKKGECTAGLLILYYIKALLKLTFGRNFGLICMDGLVGGGLTTGHPGSSL